MQLRPTQDVLSRPLTLGIINALLVAFVFIAPPQVQAGSKPHNSTSDFFVDAEGHTFERAIAAVAGRGVTKGCNPPANDRFCPDQLVTRGQMAAFLSRVMGLTTSDGHVFVDSAGHTFENAIRSIAAAEITRGCNPPKNDAFCPDEPVTRGQMAAFLARAKQLPAPSGSSQFVDARGHVFDNAIRAIAEAGITQGCNPPKNDHFCPDDKVTRGQMAAFIARAWGLPAPPARSEATGPIVIKGETGTVIEGLRISNPHGACIRIDRSTKIILRDSTIGPCGGEGVEILHSSAVTLDHVSIHDTELGVYAVESRSIVVGRSTFTDTGRNFIQFDRVTGSGNEIIGNTGSNQTGASDAEDLISVYKSGGTSASPLLITGNRLSGGGPSSSGSGILVGDKGGSHIVVRSNVLTDPGQAGIGVAGGRGIRILDNEITSNKFPWSNVGLYVWNQSSRPCSDIEVKGNVVVWRNAAGKHNAAWNGGNCGIIAGWKSNDFR